MKLQQGYFMLQNNEVLLKTKQKKPLDYKLNVLHQVELSSIRPQSNTPVRSQKMSAP